MRFSGLFLSIALLFCIQSAFSADQELVGVWTNPTPATYPRNEAGTGDLCCIPKSITITKKSDSNNYVAKYDYDGAFSSNPNQPCITLFFFGKAELGLAQKSITYKTYSSSIDLSNLSFGGVNLGSADPFTFTLGTSSLNIQLNNYYYSQGQQTCNFTMQSYSKGSLFSWQVILVIAVLVLIILCIICKSKQSKQVGLIVQESQQPIAVISGYNAPNSFGGANAQVTFNARF